MRALTETRRYRPVLALAILTTLVGCGEDGGGNGDGTGGGGGSTATGGNTSGGSTATGGNTSGGTTGSGGTAGTGATGGGGVTGARSCERDCEALASTLCAEADFTIETCVADCEQAFQAAAADADAQGCLEEFLVLDVCRAVEPVCTHPNPMRCVPENDAFIQCLEGAI